MRVGVISITVVTAVSLTVIHIHCTPLPVLTEGSWDRSQNPHSTEKKLEA